MCMFGYSPSAYKRGADARAGGCRIGSYRARRVLGARWQSPAIGTRIRTRREFPILPSSELRSTDSPRCRPSFALNSDVRTLSRRLAHLESLFAAQSSPSAFNSPQAPSIPSRHRIASPREETRAPHSDTEDAANGLEDVAFEARVPILRTMSKVPTYSSTRLTPGQDRPGAELTSAGTSILVDGLLPDQDGRPRSAVRLGLDLSVPTGELLVCRSAAMAQIFAVLPGKHISDFLLQKVRSLPSTLPNSSLTNLPTSLSTSPRSTGTLQPSTSSPSSQSTSGTSRCAPQADKTRSTHSGLQSTAWSSPSPSMASGAVRMARGTWGSSGGCRRRRCRTCRLFGMIVR